MVKRKLMKRLIGTCGVDAGMLMMVDPCYVQGEQALAHWPEWGKFLTASGMQKDDKWPEHGIVPINRPESQFDGKAVGVVVHTYAGDGEYPVYAWFDEDGKITKVEVNFTRRA